MFELLTENNISFPDGFLWGTGTAGHQIEGNNIHSQRWNEELADRVRYPEVSAEACGSWERFRRDAGWRRNVVRKSTAFPWNGHGLNRKRGISMPPR